MRLLLADVVDAPHRHAPMTPEQVDRFVLVLLIIAVVLLALLAVSIVLGEVRRHLLAREAKRERDAERALIEAQVNRALAAGDDVALERARRAAALLGFRVGVRR